MFDSVRLWSLRLLVLWMGCFGAVNLVAAQTCPIALQISYANGERGCLTDLPIAKQQDKKWGKTVEDILKNMGQYSVAASAVCPDVHVAWRGVNAGAVYSFQAQLDATALGGCEKRCECATLIRNGQVLVNKNVAMAVGSQALLAAATPQATEQSLALQQQERDHQLALQKLEEQKRLETERQKEQQRLQAESDKRMKEQLARAQLLKEQQRSDEEAKLKEQVRKEKELQEREAALLAQEKRFREQQRQAEEARLKEEERILQSRKREQEAQRADTQKTSSDRELLMQLAAELSKLRTQQLASEAAANVSPAPVLVANRKALVIGNNRYAYINPLSTAGEDAKSIADNLKNVGYKVTLKLDLNEKEFKAALRQFRNQVDSGDEIAFFYAGHGVQLNGSNFLVPIDVAGESEDQLKDEAIPLQRFLDDMTDKRAKLTLAMIDACRDNPFKSAGRSVGGGTRGLAPTTAATGQLIIYSAGAGQQALDKLGPGDRDKNGVFTRVFIKEMQKPGVPIDRVVRSIRSEVVNMAKSIGHEQVPAIYDQMVGEFYFRPK